MRIRDVRVPRAAGFSIIEVIVFIVVVGLGIAGILAVMNLTAQRSADPGVRKQALAVAEALLEEVELMAFTYCDPSDANVTTAQSAAGCTGGAGGANDQTKLPLGPQAGETRYSTTTPFDNVADYNGFDTATATPAGIADITGTAVSGLSQYRATVSVQPTALAGTGYTVASGTAVLITVTVTGPNNESISLQGYRTRYAPRSP
jgi:MSHA pilin protein MshD